MKLPILFIIFAVLTSPAIATEYKIIPNESEISFSGVHAGNEFNGQFEEWDAQIIFDPKDLRSSQITASFNLKSAKTGNAMYDGTLPQADWFDVKNHPEAAFVSQSITANPDGTYRVIGELNIRGIANKAEFNFSLSDLDAAPVSADGILSVDRLAYDIGNKSDPEAEWVSQNIDISLSLKANPILH